MYRLSTRASSVARRVVSASVVSSRDAISSNNINNLAHVMQHARSFTAAPMLCSEAKPEASDNEEGAEAPTSDAESKEGAEAGGEEQSAEAARIAELEEQVKSLKDQVLRSMADEENVRRIAKKDVENARQYGIQSFAKSMLDVADNFERAIESVPEGGAEASTDPVFKAFFEGIVAVEKGLQKSFAANGLTKYGEVGDAFDPEAHEALFQVPDAEQDEGLVAQVLKKGYRLKDRTLRAAQVGTTRKP